MSKALFVDAIAAKTGLTKAQAGEAFDAVTETITNAVSKGERLALPGLFTIEVKDQPAKEGRNPATGATMQIPAKKVPKVKIGAGLKAAANK